MKGVNTVNIVGNLRAGGDTKLALYIDTGALWLIGVPLSFIAAFYFKLPVYLVYFVTFFEEITKAIFGIKRVFSKKWIKNLVKDID
jgi:Na+-driven multidrug efflux pump